VDQTSFRIEIAKLVVALAGLGGTVAAAILAVRTFGRTEEWKKTEFLAREMKEFFDNPRVQNAFTMIDWGARDIKLFDESSENKGRVPVTRMIQVHALLPHTFFNTASDVEKSGDGVTGSHSYTPDQAAIRDCYDSLLDGLERFSNYVQTGLIDIDSLRPYLQYWIDDIQSPAKDNEDAAWSAALATFIAFYRFDGVRWLFRGFNRSIDPSDAAFKSFIAKMKDQDLAKKLQEAASAAVPLPNDDRN